MQQIFNAIAYGKYTATYYSFLKHVKGLFVGYRGF